MFRIVLVGLPGEGKESGKLPLGQAGITAVWASVEEQQPTGKNVLETHSPLSPAVLNVGVFPREKGVAVEKYVFVHLYKGSGCLVG